MLIISIGKLLFLFQLLCKWTLAIIVKASWRGIALLFIGYEAPKVRLKKIGVHLHLLQAVFAECTKSHAFHQCLKDKSN